MKWNKQAEEAICRVPFFVRKRVRKRVEEEALRCGAPEVTPDHVWTCQQRFLNRMEDEVKGYQVETCFGPGGCPNRAVISEGTPGKIEERISRRNLKAFLNDRVHGSLKMHHEFRISISDCPNACSRPQIMDLGIIGACRPEISEMPCTECGACVEACKEHAVSLEGNRPVIEEEKCLFCAQCIRACPTGTLQEGPKGYRVQIGGKLGRHPQLATELPGIFPPEDMLDLIDQCLDLYQRHCVEGERFGEILNRTAKDKAETIAAHFAPWRG